MTKARTVEKEKEEDSARPIGDEAAFVAAYETLNPAQKKAVDAVEGPVMVIAGPGTGKTHILTLRIANILRQTQATPDNILALTFTESAARTVRARLAGLIGPKDANRVNVYTFHSFCDFVLTEHAHFFPEYVGRRLAGDVESTLLWREVLDTEHVVHLSPPKAPYHYLRGLERLGQDLARDRMTLAEYRAWAESEVQRIRDDATSYYTRDAKHGRKGDFKKTAQENVERFERVYEAARLIEAYRALKEERGVYDFSDVLTAVVAGLEGSDALRQQLQEQYQYILADEHQDANALQHALLDAFAFDDHPNLFVVGDEKQAIFRFQGADSTHFREFLIQYPRTLVIPLMESFRSAQRILDAAHALATEHITSAYGKHEPLTSARKGEGADKGGAAGETGVEAELSLLEAPDPLAERDQVAHMVAEAIQKGTKPEEISVIAARNATVERMSEHLAGRGIPTLRAGDISLASRPLVRALVALMRTVADPLDTSALREALLAPWWGMELAERASFLARTRESELPSALAQTFPKVAEAITALREKSAIEAPMPLFSRLLVETGARSFLLSHPEGLEDMALVRKIAGYLEEAVRRDPSTSFSDAVAALTRAGEHGLHFVRSSALTREGFVTVITTHKAKGMEFDKVFIVGATENEWERGGRGDGIPSPAAIIREQEDAAKGFYVALTRAKDYVTVSYAAETLEGKERKPSKLIPEGLAVKHIEPSSDPLPILYHDTSGPKLATELTCAYLEREGLSPSALQDYLKSPALFFARRVLHLRDPEDTPRTIGTAVHAGIAGYLSSGTKEHAYAALEAALGRSLLPRNRAYEAACKDARVRLDAFFPEAKTLGKPAKVEYKLRATRTVNGKPVILSGTIDALFEREGDGSLTSTKSRTIVDFKTSSKVTPEDPNISLQLAFYGLLLEENNMPATDAEVVQVTGEGIQRVPFVLSGARGLLDTVLPDVLTELLNGTWRPATEASDYDDLLKLFN